MKLHRIFSTLGITLIFVLLHCEIVGADDLDFQRAVYSLKNLKNNEGEPPDIKDYFGFISEHGRHFSFNEQMDLYVEVLRMQRPVIALTEIISITRAKQDSISDVISRYTVSKAGLDRVSNREVSVVNSYTFAYDRGKLHFDQTLSDNNNIARQTFSYDGERRSRVDFPRGREMTPFAAIGNLDADGWFFQREFPLLQAMVFNTNKLNDSQKSLDLYVMLNTPGTHVYQKRTVIDGVSCILVANMARRVYLDPERDFSVIRYEGYRVEFGTDDNITGASLITRRVFEDLKDYGNGLWLPSKIKNSFYENGQKIWAETITVEKLAINEGIDESLFTGNFPEKTLVFDVDRNFSYLQSDSPSIDGLLRSVVQSKRVWTLQIISVTLGILMIVAALARLWYLKRKNAIMSAA